MNKKKKQCCNEGFPSVGREELYHGGKQRGGICSGIRQCGGCTGPAAQSKTQKLRRRGREEKIRDIVESIKKPMELESR